MTNNKIICFLLFIINLIGMHTTSFALTSTKEDARELRAKIELNPYAYQQKQNHAQKIILPLSKGFDQKDTCLCWSYAFFNIIETLYLLEHPGKTLELSRGAMQYINMKDRLDLKIAQVEDHLNLEVYKNCWAESGTILAALYLVKNYGALQFHDYHDIISPFQYLDISNTIAVASTPDQKRKIAKTLLPIYFGYDLPKQTFFNDTWMSSREFGNAILPKGNWVTYAISKDGTDYLDKDIDPDTRRGEMNFFTTREKIISRIINSLKNNRPVAYANKNHLVMIYGIEHTKNDEIVKFYIKDSYADPDYVYEADTIKTLENLHQITILE